MRRIKDKTVINAAREIRERLQSACSDVATDACDIESMGFGHEDIEIPDCIDPRDAVADDKYNDTTLIRDFIGDWIHDASQDWTTRVLIVEELRKGAHDALRITLDQFEKDWQKEFDDVRDKAGEDGARHLESELDALEKEW